MHRNDPCSIPGRVTPDLRMWESCRTMRLVGGFSRGSPVSPALSFRRCSILTSVTLIGSQDLDVKSRPNLFTSLRRDMLQQCLKKKSVVGCIKACCVMIEGWREMSRQVVRCVKACVTRLVRGVVVLQAASPAAAQGHPQLDYLNSVTVGADPYSQTLNSLHQTAAAAHHYNQLTAAAVSAGQRGAASHDVLRRGDADALHVRLKSACSLYREQSVVRNTPGNMLVTCHPDPGAVCEKVETTWSKKCSCTDRSGPTISVRGRVIVERDITSAHV
ncbi:hypothetical protein PR048_029492 [Dryococelus australis]|uniref:Uncharacterized protein n=1 Tax=Dryococelus australis TaxID=614101 RepID=A0ABQ9GDI8_9NEOP|nr:hypothetical protein PR048_029492 [Dryococelus australis]